VFHVVGGPLDSRSMVCPACSKNSYIAAKRGHIQCVREHREWDARTLCGAIRSKSREVYDQVRALEPPNMHTPAMLIVENAVNVGWLDVVQEHIEFCHDIKKIAIISLKCGHYELSKYILGELPRDILDQVEHQLFYSAVMSGNLQCIDMVNDMYEKNLWITTPQMMLYAAAVSSNKPCVWHILTRCTPPTEQHLVSSVAFSIDLKKYTSAKVVTNIATTLRVPLPPELKTMCIRTRDVQMLRMLYRNNEEWPANFSHVLESQIEKAGPRIRVLLEQMREFAESCGADKIGELMRIINDVDMPPAKRQRFETLVKLF